MEGEGGEEGGREGEGRRGYSTLVRQKSAPKDIEGNGEDHAWGGPLGILSIPIPCFSQARGKLETKPDTGMITEVNPPKPNS